MGLAFKLILHPNTRFVRVGHIPESTASAIYPPQTGEPALTESGLDLEEIKYATCVSQHERALDKAIDAGMVTLLNPLSYEVHTFPFGEARKQAVITLDDFKLFAASLQIEVVLDSAPWTGTPSPEGYLTIREAASAIARKYEFNEPTSDTMLKQLSSAAERGELVVRHPQTLLPYMPQTLIDFYDLVSVADLNAWLEKQGGIYWLDLPEQEPHEDESAESSRTIGNETTLLNRNEVMAKFPVKADADANRTFWDYRLSNPSDPLKNAKKFAGKPGTSALWEPLGIAHYLLGGGRVKCHMRLKQLDEVMNKHFPKLVDSWKEQTEDKR